MSPLQVTHLAPVWDLLLPLAQTPDRRDHRLFSVSSKRHRQMWGERNRLSFETVVGGIEPPSPRLTVRRSTTRPLLPSTVTSCDTTDMTLLPLRTYAHVQRYGSGNLQTSFPVRILSVPRLRVIRNRPITQCQFDVSRERDELALSCRRLARVNNRPYKESAFQRMSALRAILLGKSR